ncbi:MAG: hypothetical protein HRU75_03705 [Planctomycetia bacterium]|nr:MAG: hypothetical protein HRU75_03705 [Planctomycetia bacterium]
MVHSITVAGRSALAAEHPAITDRGGVLRDRGSTAESDRVLLSADALRGMEDAARSRQLRLAALRASIQSGTYLTPEKLDAAVWRLYAELKK